MTELKYLKDIVAQLKGIQRELHKHNEIMQRWIEGVKDETDGDMETGKSDEE